MKILNVGFTGTSHVLTEAAAFMLAEELREIDTLSKDYGAKEIWAHGGDCIVADDMFHRLATGLGWKSRGHIPINDEKRAFCKYDIENPPLNYFGRNRTIVQAADVMYATPGRMYEEPRGGTWYTINYTRKQAKPLAIIWPDGTVTYERWEDPSMGEVL